MWITNLEKRRTRGDLLEISQAVVCALKDWEVADRVEAMCFDTTAANTGCRAGTCSLIETTLKKDLLPLACRHHVHEVILGDVFKHVFGPSSGPQIALFKPFHEKWSHMDTTKFKSACRYL